MPALEAGSHSSADSSCKVIIASVHIQWAMHLIKDVASKQEMQLPVFQKSTRCFWKTRTTYTFASIWGEHRDEVPKPASESLSCFTIAIYYACRNWNSSAGLRCIDINSHPAKQLTTMAAQHDPQWQNYANANQCVSAANVTKVIKLGWCTWISRRSSGEPECLSYLKSVRALDFGLHERLQTFTNVTGEYTKGEASSTETVWKNACCTSTALNLTHRSVVTLVQFCDLAQWEALRRDLSMFAQDSVAVLFSLINYNMHTSSLCDACCLSSWDRSGERSPTRGTLCQLLHSAT